MGTTATEEIRDVMNELKSVGIVGKNGITGNSGVVPFGHLAMPFDGNGKVFVVWTYRRKFPNGKIEKHDGWKRMSYSRAVKEKRVIINCSYCKRPASRLDHYWPYMSEMNACSEHMNSFREGMSKDGSKK